MGTFHDNKHELHGITVVVDTRGPEVFVGRCDDIDERGVILLDADAHHEQTSGRSKREYLEGAARYGVWKRFNRVIVPHEEVASIRPLGEL